MAPAPLSLYEVALTQILVAGEAETIIFGPISGGFIWNPATPADQDIESVETLFVDPTGAEATLGPSATTVPIQPGQYFFIPRGQTTNISVNAATKGHHFTAVVFQPPTPFPPTPQTGTFPPSGPTTLTETLASYLYQQYNDDDDLQAFVAAFNAIAQGYVSWFATVPLAVYTSPLIVGTLLDWVAEGVYGMQRPTLSPGGAKTVGPLNTYPYDTLPLNVRRVIVPSGAGPASDDVFKRIMTWNFYKGDGNVFNCRWLKRRIMRFLIGSNGSAPNVDQTYPVSVTFGASSIAIRIEVGTSNITGGALYNRFGFNRMTNNGLRTLFRPPATQYPFAPVLKECIESGVLLLPFQYSFSILV